MPISSIVEAALVPSQLLGELFVQNGLITHEELELALEEQKVDGKRLGEILVKLGFVSGPALTTVLAEQLGVEMETQEGFGSGLWSEIKKRHLRGRSGEEEGLELEAEALEPEPAAEPQLEVISGLFEGLDDRQVAEPVAGAGVVDEELQNLRQQLSFAAERLDEERAAHEGTQRLLDEARAEAEAHSREAEEWHERAARAEDAGEETQAAHTDLAKLNGVVTDLRVELAARDEALQHAAEAQAEVAGDLDRLQAELTALRDGRAKAEDHLTVLVNQLEDERAGHAETQELVAGAHAEAVELTSAVAELRAELAARDEMLERESAAEAELRKQLEDESAGRAGAQDLLDDARVEAVELTNAVAELRAELAARDEMLERESAAKAERVAELARLQAELAELRERDGLSEANLAALTEQLEDERDAREAARRAVDEWRTEATQLESVVVGLRAALAEREEALRRDTETEAEREAELMHLQANLSKIQTQLEDESAGRARTQELLAELRAELDAREEAIERYTEAEAEREAESVRLRANLAKITEQLEAERAGHTGAQDLLDDARIEAVELASAVAELRAELAAREEALQRDTEIEAQLEAELARLQEHSSAVVKQLEDERAAHEAEQQLVEASRTEAAELDEAVTRLRAELMRRDAVAAEHAEQLGGLRDELAARDAARDREADARVEMEAEVAKLRADTLVLHQRLDDERAENVASRREVGRLESQLSEIGLVGELLAEAERDLAAKTDEFAELALELEHVRGLLADQRAPSPVEDVVSGHIVFRPGTGGYELVERPGPAPEVGTVADVDGDRYLVTRIGSSPLPADRRRCAYLEAA